MIKLSFFYIEYIFENWDILLMGWESLGVFEMVYDFVDVRLIILMVVGMWFVNVVVLVGMVFVEVLWQIGFFFNIDYLF